MFLKWVKFFSDITQLQKEKDDEIKMLLRVSSMFIFNFDILRLREKISAINLALYILEIFKNNTIKF